MEQYEWKAAVAAVIDERGDVRGTAFFVGVDAALTCDHVIRAAGGAKARLRRVGSELIEDVVSQDAFEEQDLVLLRVAGGTQPRWLHIHDGTVRPGAEVSSYGFPLSKQRDYPDGYPLAGAKVSGSTKVAWKGNLVPVLLVARVEAEQGMSGAPLVDGDRGDVVGILRFSNLADKTAHAIPTVTARERWPGLRTSATMTGVAPATFEELKGSPDWLAWTRWEQFDPARLHCVVVDSESSLKWASADRLSTLVGQLFTRRVAVGLWDSFTSAWRGRRLVRTGDERPLPDQYSPAAVSVSKFSVVDAFSSRGALEAATRMLVEADLVVADVTTFEPAVMLLLGVRASTRRGVTVNSHGGGWREGDPLNRPFNLSDLSLASHTRVPGTKVGSDLRLPRLVERIETGFDQLGRQPHYLDLPVYDALRQLGSEDKASASIPADDEVLVLCSYGEDYFQTWEELAREVNQALSDKGHLSDVTRLVDRATPQLVSQSLYERIRRCSGCIGDWTYASPSTFFEIGVRLAVSPWSIVQVVDQEWFERVRSSTGEPRIGQQVESMRELFGPLSYRSQELGDGNLGRRVVKELLATRDEIQGRGGHRIRQVVAQALGRVAESIPGPVQQLRDDADALNHLGRMRVNVPQALFYEVAEIKADQEAAARERRLAAWLYLEHRIRAKDLPKEDHSRKLWFDLGEAVATDLLASGDGTDFETGLEISERLRSDRTDLSSLERGVALQRQRGDALSKRQRGSEAREAYGLALEDVDVVLTILEVPSSVTPTIVRAFDHDQAAEAAEWLGVQGGLLHRLSAATDDADAARKAVESYERGAAFESGHRLPQTYNRTNAIKRSLITGLRTMTQVADDLVELRAALEERLASDEQAADDAWVWADLGDACLLLGDLATAVSAYHTFATKARTDSPDSTLSVLRQIAAALSEHEDPEAPRVARAIEEVAAMLRPVSSSTR